MLETKTTKNIVYAFNKGYRALENGDIISPKKKLLKGCISYTCGIPYKSFTVRVKGEACGVPVHRFVAFQKFGYISFSCDCIRHLNGNSLDNSYKNIEMGTTRDNILDIPKEKRVEYAKNAAKHIMVYDENDVMEIKSYHNKTKSYKMTMEKFGITSKGTLHNILNNR